MQPDFAVSPVGRRPWLSKRSVLLAWAVRRGMPSAAVVAALGARGNFDGAHLTSFPHMLGIGLGCSKRSVLAGQSLGRFCSFLGGAYCRLTLCVEGDAQFGTNPSQDVVRFHGLKGPLDELLRGTGHCGCHRQHTPGESTVALLSFQSFPLCPSANLRPRCWQVIVLQDELAAIVRSRILLASSKSAPTG